jgi:hypothetical protein
MYFKGIAEIIGEPNRHSVFVNKMKEKHPNTYEAYTNLPDEILIKIELTECRVWGFDKGKSKKNKQAITVFDLINNKQQTIFCDKM